MPSHRVPSPPLTALVTGASSGLGEAIARELSSRGLRLLLASENAQDLERVRAGLALRGEARALVQDLTLPDAPELLYERCVDVLVTAPGSFSTSTASWRIPPAPGACWPCTCRPPPGCAFFSGGTCSPAAGAGS